MNTGQLLHAVSEINRSDSDRAPVANASEQDLNPDVYEPAFTKAKQLMPRAFNSAKDTTTVMKRLNLLDNDENVTKAGLLTTGYYPQQFFPKLFIDVAVHPGTQKASDATTRFIDRTLCEGTLGEMISDAIAAVSKNLRRSSKVIGTGRVDKLEIPEEAIREAIANAVIHRDYDARFDGQAISVDIFADRIEVLNPGGLWGGKSKNNLADGRSCCRNPTIMKLMQIVPLPKGAGTPAEGNGTGIQLMIRSCAAKGLLPPVFKPSFDHFKVILYRPTDFNPSDNANNPTALILSALAEQGELSSSELSEMTGLPLSKVRSQLRNMVENETVIATAPRTSRNRKYRLP